MVGKEELEGLIEDSWQRLKRHYGEYIANHDRDYYDTGVPGEEIQVEKKGYNHEEFGTAIYFAMKEADHLTGLVEAYLAMGLGSCSERERYEAMGGFANEISAKGEPIRAQWIKGLTTGHES